MDRDRLDGERGRTEYTFNLRDGVTFSDGTPLDAAAVAKNFDIYGLGEHGPRPHHLGGDQQLRRQRGRRRRHRHVPLHGPAPGFLQATSTINSGCSRPPRSTAARGIRRRQRDRDRRLGPVRHHRGGARHELHLEAREDYDWAPPSFEHQGRAYLDAIHLIVTPEDSVRIGSLLAGQADVHPLRPGLRRGAGRGRRLRGLRPADPRRQQLARPAVHEPAAQRHPGAPGARAGVDAQEVVDTIFTENYPVATSVLAATALGYKDESENYAYDPEKSEALLDDAGWTVGADGIREKDGQRLSLTSTRRSRSRSRSRRSSS